MIVVNSSLYTVAIEADIGSKIPILCTSKDDGDVYNVIGLTEKLTSNLQAIKGIMIVSEYPIEIDQTTLITEYEVILNAVKQEDKCRFKGVLIADGQYFEQEVQVIPSNNLIFDRIKGLYETDALANKRALIIGLGSGGSTIAIELAKAGVSEFILVDHDRLEIGNVVRHACGISDVGRYKTKAIKDKLLDKNPVVSVSTYEELVNFDWIPQLMNLVKQVDIVFCCTDNRESRMIVNKICVDADCVCIYGGTFRRAYGGQVLRIRPGETLCYQCFIDIMPEADEDFEVSSQEQASSLAYSDREVAVEPGLATDIAPISNLCVKLGILELLRDTETTLKSLHDDFTFAVYQWLNRREVDTQYAKLPPLPEAEDEMRILSWYGMDIPRNNTCISCGDALESMKESVSQEDIDFFSSGED